MATASSRAPADALWFASFWFPLDDTARALSWPKRETVIARCFERITRATCTIIGRIEAALRRNSLACPRRCTHLACDPRAAGPCQSRLSVMTSVRAMRRHAGSARSLLRLRRRAEIAAVSGRNSGLIRFGNFADELSLAARCRALSRLVRRPPDLRRVVVRRHAHPARITGMRGSRQLPWCPCAAR